MPTDPRDSRPPETGRAQPERPAGEAAPTGGHGDTPATGRAAGARPHGGRQTAMSDIRAAEAGVTEPRQCGQYRLLRKLGEGGMGEVFEAEDEFLNRHVAVKRLRADLLSNWESRDRFVREARAAAAVESDYLVTIYAVGVTDEGNVPYFAMQLLSGEPLEKRLEREPPLTYVEIARIGREMAEGLAAAHERGLIHRDIKPGNVWLEDPPGSSSGNSGIFTKEQSSPTASSAARRRRKRVKIVDFGLAIKAEMDIKLTQTGYVMGTPAYMSPEQTRGKKLDYRSDLFSLGAVLYEMVAGVRPFKGNSLAAMMRAIESDPAPLLSLLKPDVPRELSDLVSRLLAKKPEDRPQDTFDVADRLADIEAVLSGRPVGSNRTSRVSATAVAAALAEAEPTPLKQPDRGRSARPEAAAGPPRRNVLAIAGIVAAAAAVVAAGAFFALQPAGFAHIKVGYGDNVSTLARRSLGALPLDAAGSPVPGAGLLGVGRSVMELPPGRYRLEFGNRADGTGHEVAPSPDVELKPGATVEVTLRRK